MEISEIVSELKFLNPCLPEAALQAAIEKKDAMIPELIEFVNYAIRNIDEVDNN